MRNGDIHSYILSVHIRGTQGISQFAVMSEHRDTLHRRFDESQSQSERGGEKKYSHILSGIEIWFPSSYSNFFFIFLGVFHLSITYVVAPLYTSPVGK